MTRKDAIQMNLQNNMENLIEDILGYNGMYNLLGLSLKKLIKVQKSVLH